MSPEKSTAKKPAAETAVESSPVKAGEPGGEAVSEPKQQIESSLVGAGASTPAASKRTSGPAGSTLAPEAAAASPVPPVSRPDPKQDVAPASATEAAKKAAVETAPPPRTETKVEVRKVGFFPTFLGGVVAAGLGAAATYWAIPHLPPSLQPLQVEAADPEAQIEAARQAASETARSEIEARMDDLTSRSADAGADAARQLLADTAPPEQPAAAPLEIPAEITDKIAALEKSLADLASRPAAPTEGQAPAAPVQTTPAVSQAELDELADRVNAQQARIDELAARPTVDPATAEQVQNLAKQAEELQQSSADANRRAQAATAASALQAAIEAGAARDQALDELSAAGVEVPSVLTGDIPRLEQLRSEFPAAARAGLRASLDAEADSGGAMDMISNFLRVQTGARSVQPREGSDPDAILSRADAAIEAGDVKGALDEVAALPQAGQQAMSDWIGRAKIWVEANAAMAALVAGSR
ncbi:hypothetical protein RGQ15_01485 [Paracoccus sp. MBLB3053]|uniref:Mitochondrial inner membrane protein n=1 Tax=Paracoccus aurantius TaxID=3073814 RepID=A0ABU2HMJ1_9RHOB|nr:hypothetical protein [Paracoccus sp. MBLB3053]MDS9466244.1 hypothetical protein [Paracoccus sp. MBLB3053]